MHVALPDGSQKDFKGLRAAALTATKMTGTGVFRWRVRANFPKGRFGTVPGRGRSTRPFTRTLGRPAGARTVGGGRSVHFAWQPKAGAQEYVVQVSERPDFSRASERETTDATTYAPALDRRFSTRGSKSRRSSSGASRPSTRTATRARSRSRSASAPASGTCVLSAGGIEETPPPADKQRMSTPASGLRWIPLGRLLVDGRILTRSSSSARSRRRPRRAGGSARSSSSSASRPSARSRAHSPSSTSSSTSTSTRPPGQAGDRAAARGAGAPLRGAAAQDPRGRDAAARRHRSDRTSRLRTTSASRSVQLPDRGRRARPDRARDRARLSSLAAADRRGGRRRRSRGGADQRHPQPRLEHADDQPRQLAPDDRARRGRLRPPFRASPRGHARPHPRRRRHARARDGAAAHAAGGHEPAQDHGQARHRRPPRAQGRPRDGVLRHRPHRHADRRRGDDPRRAGRAADPRTAATSGPRSPGWRWSRTPKRRS